MDWYNDITEIMVTLYKDPSDHHAQAHLNYIIKRLWWYEASAQLQIVKRAMAAATTTKKNVLETGGTSDRID